MKKSMILLGMLSIGYANAQEGNVGINIEAPKATLHIQPNADNLTKTTNEGIIAPKLTKERIAGIADANLVEGTLVYATDATYAGTNTKVAKITEKGYYFYNGTEWVKAGADISSQVWKYDGAKAYINEEIKDKVEYLKNGGYRHFPKEMRPVTSSESGALQDATLDVDGASIYNWGLSFSDLVSGTSVSTKWPYKSLNEHLFVIDENEKSSYNNYYSNFTKLQTNQKTTRNISALYSTIGYATHFGSGNVARIMGGNFGGYINNGSANEVLGAFNTATLNTAGNVPTAIGARNRVSLRSSGNITTVVASQNQLTLESSASAGYDFKSAVNNVYLTQNVADLTNNNITGGAIENMMGTYTNIRVPLNNAIKVNNLYGLYINDIRNATARNYAIYSNAGQIRFGDLADTSATTDRAVVVDKDGVLKVGTSITATNGLQNIADMECNADNRGKMNFIPSTDNTKSDVFGICMRNKDGNYYWGYMVGGNNPTNGTGAFGSGL